MRIFQVCIFFLCLVVILYISLFFVYGEKIKEAKGKRPAKIKLSDSEIVQELELYKNFVEATHTSTYFNETKWEECKTDKTFLAMVTKFLFFKSGILIFN